MLILWEIHLNTQKWTLRSGLH